MRKETSFIVCVLISLTFLFQWPGQAEVYRPGRYDDQGVHSPSRLFLSSANILFPQIRKLLAADGGSLNYFGWAADISGNWAIVGAYWDNDYGIYSGSAYIYSRHRGGTDNWGQVKKLIPADLDSYDYFGSSVAIYGDWAIVGAAGNGTDTGSAYIFYRHQGGANNWGEVKKLTGGSVGSRFGYPVAISGDTVVVGTLGVGGNTGAATIFQRHHGGTDNWGEVKKLTSGNSRFTYYAYSVAIAGDTVLIGAIYNDSRSYNAGAVHLYRRHHGGTDNWGEVKVLTADDGSDSDYFGTAVAAYGETVVVGAVRDDFYTGSSYIFQRHLGGTDNWGQAAKLSAADGQTSDRFGCAVDIDGDTVVVGAEGDDSKTGSAYIFQRHQGGTDNWGQVTKLSAADKQASNHFGYSASIAADHLLFGAYGDDDNGSGSGSAYVFRSYQAVEADVAVSMTVSNHNPAENDDTVFTVDVTNHGPLGADGLQVEDLLPPGLVYVNSATSTGNYNFHTGIWDIGSLANGSRASLEITARVTEANKVTNTARKIRQYGSDPDSDNDSASVTLFGNNPPEVTIIEPGNGAAVSGTVEVEVTASDDKGIKSVDFYIDGTLKKSLKSAPYTYLWDSTQVANGSHKIKVVAVDDGGLTDTDHTSVEVKNIYIQLQVSRFSERAWLIRKFFARITLGVSNPGPLTAAKYVVQRRESGSSTFQSVREITAAEIQNHTYTFNDLLPQQDTFYTYRAVALDSSGAVVGRSAEKTI